MEANQNEIEARQKRIEELEREMSQLRFEAITMNTELECNERYEVLLKTEPWNIAKGVQEAVEFSITGIRRFTNAELNQILDFFDGKSPTQQRKHMMNFLNEFSCYRTNDFKKLRNRLETLRSMGKEALEQGNDETNFYQYCKDIGFRF